MGWQLAAYRSLSQAITLLGDFYLRRRLTKGKEHPTRWREKLGIASVARPEGKLVWLNAVGLGEVLSVRGLIAQMQTQDPRLNFLVTSSARSTFAVLQRNLPQNSIHQFLPLDSPKFVARFLRYWQPNLSIWIDQDLWPNAVVAAARQQIPMAIVNARISSQSYRRRRYGAGLFLALFRHFSLILAQDHNSAFYLRALGARDVQVFASIKAAAPALFVDDNVLKDMAFQVRNRKIWLLASSWAEDEAIALRSHAQLLQDDPSALLIVAPRDVSRAPQIVLTAAAMGLHATQRSISPQIATSTHVYVADTFGEMGLWYRLCPVALIGGTFGATEGHNPWEAAVLGCAILHGPRTGNFLDDFALLGKEGAALCVDDAGLFPALMQDHRERINRARHLTQDAQKRLAPLAAQLIGLMQ